MCLILPFVCCSGETFTVRKKNNQHKDIYYSYLVPWSQHRTYGRALLQYASIVLIMFPSLCDVLVLGIVGTVYVACMDEHLTKDGNQKHLNTIVVSLVHYVGLCFNEERDSDI